MGRRGSLKYAPITRLDGDRLIMVCLWIDREAFPGQPLFNPVTEGCLPMSILLADSSDGGETWSPWRVVPMPGGRRAAEPDHRAPPLPERAAAAEHRDEQGVPRQFAVVPARRPPLVGRRRASRGRSRSPSCRTRPAGSRTGTSAAPWRADGRLVSFSWTYDFEAVAYREHPAADQRGRGAHVRGAHRARLRRPAGPSRPPARRAGRPRLGRSLRVDARSARASPRGSMRPFDAGQRGRPVTTADAREPRDAGRRATTTGDALVEMQAWSYGLRLRRDAARRRRRRRALRPGPRTAGSMSAGSGWPSMIDEAGEGPMSTRPTRSPTPRSRRWRPSRRRVLPSYALDYYGSGARDEQTYRRQPGGLGPVVARPAHAQSTSRPSRSRRRCSATRSRCRSWSRRWRRSGSPIRTASSPRRGRRPAPARSWSCRPARWCRSRRSAPSPGSRSGSSSTRSRISRQRSR